MMTDKAWKICKEKSDAPLGSSKIYGVHPIYTKWKWITACKYGNILGYWNWVEKQDKLSKINLEK